MTAAKEKRCRRKRPRRGEASRFYDPILAEGDQLALAVAAEVEGLDQEIAVLRLRLRMALDEHPENMPLMLKGVDMLVKAVSARHRLSKNAKAELSENIRGTLEELGRLMSPEEESDADGSAG